MTDKAREAALKRYVDQFNNKDPEECYRAGVSDAKDHCRREMVRARLQSEELRDELADKTAALENIAFWGCYCAKPGCSCREDTAKLVLAKYAGEK